MINYNIISIVNALKEVCNRYILTQNIEIKTVKYIKDKTRYLIILNDNTKHFVEQNLINQYIENFGKKGGLQIAGLLRHNIELEESAFTEEMEDRWEGNTSDVIDYLNRHGKENEE